MLMYSNEIQIPFNIQRALFYFQNDKLLSLLAAVIARYASYMLRSTFYYSFSFVPRPSCANALFAERRRSSRAPLYRTTTTRRQVSSFENSIQWQRGTRIAAYEINQAVHIAFRVSQVSNVHRGAHDTLWYCLVR